MADQTSSAFAPEFGPLVSPLVQGALEAYGRPASAAIAPVSPWQVGANNWANALTTRPIDYGPARALVGQASRPSTQVATRAFDTSAGMQGMNPYEDLVRSRALADYDRQAAAATSRRAAQTAGGRAFNTKQNLANQEFASNIERQRGDIDAQLLQRGFESARAQYNADQARALQAALGNQTASARDRAMALQSAGALAGLEGRERSDIAQNYDILSRAGAVDTGRQQAMLDYPWNQVNRLNSIIRGSGQQVTAADDPWWKTAAGAAGAAGTAYNVLNKTGAFGADGWLSGIFRDGGHVNGYADGGEADRWEEDAAPPVMDAEFWDAEEPQGALSYMDAPSEDEPRSFDVFASDEGGGGGEAEAEDGAGGDFSVNLDGGDYEVPASGALAMAAPQTGGGLAGRLATSGYTNDDLNRLMAEAAPRQVQGGADPVEAMIALLNGIAAAPSRRLAGSLAGGNAAVTELNERRKREAFASEAARQKAAQAQAKMVSDQIAGDRKIQGQATISEAQSQAAMDREIRRLESMERQGELSRSNAEKLAELRARAQLQAAGISANATMGAARLRADAPTTEQRNLVAAGFKPGTPEFEDAMRQRMQKDGNAFDNETKLRGEFTSATKDFATVRDAYNRIQAAANPNPTGADDIALVYGFMKMLDPPSVVREGEFATAQNAGGVPDRIMNLYNRVIQGERLPESVRQDFVRQAERQYENNVSQYEKTVGQFRDLATDYKLNPDRVVRDLTATSTAAARLSTSPAGALRAAPPAAAPAGREVVVPIQNADSGLPEFSDPADPGIKALPPGSTFVAISPDGTRRLKIVPGGTGDSR